MKNLFYILLSVLLFTSCSMYKSINETVVIDYSRYTSQDFFITESNSVSFDYKPIGSVVTVVKGTKKKETGKQNDGDSVQKRKKSFFEEPRAEYYSVYEAIDEFVRKSKNAGANGTLNFKVSYTNDKEFGNGYVITGMAIKK